LELQHDPRSRERETSEKQIDDYDFACNQNNSNDYLRDNDHETNNNALDEFNDDSYPSNKRNVMPNYLQGFSSTNDTYSAIRNQIGPFGDNAPVNESGYSNELMDLYLNPSLLLQGRNGSPPIPNESQLTAGLDNRVKQSAFDKNDVVYSPKLNPDHSNQGSSSSGMMNTYCANDDFPNPVSGHRSAGSSITTTPETSEHSIASVLQSNFTIGGLEADFHGLTFQDSKPILSQGGGFQGGRIIESNNANNVFVHERFDRALALEDSGFNHYSIDKSEGNSRSLGLGYGHGTAPLSLGFQQTMPPSALRMARPIFDDVSDMQRVATPSSNSGGRSRVEMATGTSNRVSNNINPPMNEGNN